MFVQPPLTVEQRERVTKILCNLITTLITDERNDGIEIGLQHDTTYGDPYSFTPFIKHDGSITLTLRVRGAAANIDIGGGI